MQIFIIRHADPDSDYVGISKAGHLQAATLAESLRQRGVDEIYCSPMKRALDTMQYSAKILNIEPAIEEWMSELGWWIECEPWGKRSAWNLPGEVIRSEERPDPLTSQMKKDIGGLRNASDSFFERLGYKRCGGRYRVVGGNDKKIAVFTHGGFGLAWLSHLLELPIELIWCGFWLDPCSITTVHFEERSREWAVPRCLCVGDVSHLTVRGLSPETSSIYHKFKSI